MSRAPYWIRLRGTGQKVGDWDKGVSFNCNDEYKGAEVFLSSEVGSVIMRVWKDDETELTMLKVTTIPHRDWTGEFVGNKATLFEGLIQIVEPKRHQHPLFGGE